MELARYGVPISEVYRDPRPSRISRLLTAGRAVDARTRLEDIEDDVSRGGVQGAIRETYPPGKSPPPPSGIKTEMVGYKNRLTMLRIKGLLPIEKTEEELRAEQRAKLDTVFNSATAKSATALRFRVVRDSEGNAKVELVGGQNEADTQEQPGRV